LLLELTFAAAKERQACCRGGIPPCAWSFTLVATKTSIIFAYGQPWRREASRLWLQSETSSRFADATAFARGLHLVLQRTSRRFAAAHRPFAVADFNACWRQGRQDGVADATALRVELHAGGYKGRPGGFAMPRPCAWGSVTLWLQRTSGAFLRMPGPCAVGVHVCCDKITSGGFFGMHGLCGRSTLCLKLLPKSIKRETPRRRPWHRRRVFSAFFVPQAWTPRRKAGGA